MARPTELLPFNLTVNGTFDASPDLLFDAWTKVELMTWLYGKEGSASVDLRVGGAYSMEMAYEGKLYHHEGEYLRIDRPKLLEFTWISEGTDHLTSVVRVEFQPVGKKTQVTIKHVGLPEAKVADHTQGWAELLEWLDNQLKASQPGA
jgi:uncharacterized protein YndB with AHSA1/START domain